MLITSMFISKGRLFFRNPTSLGDEGFSIGESYLDPTWNFTFDAL